MWIVRKVQESAESFPEISRLVRKNSDDISSKTNLLHKLHSNILTPDKIPDFFLPPRLCRRSLAMEGIVSHCLVDPSQISQPKLESNTKVIKRDNNKRTKVAMKPVPFSLQNYESGYFESPNTRRKESLFHSTLSSYTLEWMTNKVMPKLPSIAVLKVDSVKSETSSSAESSSYSSPLTAHQSKLEQHLSSEDAFYKDLLGSKYTDDKLRLVRDSHVSQPASSTLALPLQFPLDRLQYQENFNSEHVLLFPHRGCIRLFASHANNNKGSTTIRIHVVSVEDLREPSDCRPLHCGLTLSLSPGKLQQQHSAIIKNCRNPMFNEDFFFTEPEGDEHGLRNFALQVKVLEKNSGLGRAAVLGIIIKPLAELLVLKKQS